MRASFYFLVLREKYFEFKMGNIVIWSEKFEPWKTSIVDEQIFCSLRLAQTDCVIPLFSWSLVERDWVSGILDFLEEPVRHTIGTLRNVWMQNWWCAFVALCSWNVHKIEKEIYTGK